MSTREIIPIFPTALYKNKINRSLEKELFYIENDQIKLIKNKNNQFSKNTYILNEIQFFDLKKEIEYFLEDYFKVIINTNNNIKPYITQSWLNFTNTNESHHLHFHKNSYLSGVVYLNTQEDSITFYKPDYYERIHLSMNECNIYNCASVKVPIQTNDILIFPSSLHHSVDVKKSKGTRISLSFNTFIKGNIGSKLETSELFL